MHSHSCQRQDHWGLFQGVTDLAHGRDNCFPVSFSPTMVLSLPSRSHLSSSANYKLGSQGTSLYFVTTICASAFYFILMN